MDTYCQKYGWNFIPIWRYLLQYFFVSFLDIIFIIKGIAQNIVGVLEKLMRAGDKW